MQQVRRGLRVRTADGLGRITDIVQRPHYRRGVPAGVKGTYCGSVEVKLDRPVPGYFGGKADYIYLSYGRPQDTEFSIVK